MVIEEIPMLISTGLESSNTISLSHTCNTKKDILFFRLPLDRSSCVPTRLVTGVHDVTILRVTSLRRLSKSRVGTENGLLRFISFFRNCLPRYFLGLFGLSMCSRDNDYKKGLIFFVSKQNGHCL